jgi:hypothetical protein
MTVNYEPFKHVMKIVTNVISRIMTPMLLQYLDISGNDDPRSFVTEIWLNGLGERQVFIPSGNMY